MFVKIGYFEQFEVGDAQNTDVHIQHGVLISLFSILTTLESGKSAVKMLKMSKKVKKLSLCLSN
jgi:hypothetical protein